MKALRFLIAIFMLFGLPAFAGQTQQITSSAQVPEGLQKSDWQSIRTAHEAWQHEFRQVDGQWRANNPGQRWTATFDGRGFLTTPKEASWIWGLELESYGFDSNPRPVTGTPEIKAAGQRLSYHWQGGLEEWFVNEGRGLEHGFIVAERPEGAREGEPLVFTLSTVGGLRPSFSSDAQTVHFRDGTGAPVLNYSGLKVWDAEGTILKSWFERGNDGRFQIAVEETTARYPLTIDPVAQQAYLKAGNNGGAATHDKFGFSVAVSGDTVVVGAYLEDSSTTGVNSTPNENASDSGAAYVFTRSGTTWSQQAYLKASNTGAGDYFGNSVAVSGDTMVVGAYLEDSSTTGVNSTPDENASDSGAAYVFTRSGTTWSQQAYIKASNTPPGPGAGDLFGNSVAVSGDTVIVGATGEDSSTAGVNSTPDENASDSGAAYVFTRSGTTWSQQAYLKAFNTGASDFFGNSVAVSGDTVVVGAFLEDSSTTGVNSSPNESAFNSGAAYVFVRSGSSWSQQAYLKASNTGAADFFGRLVAVSGDTVVVGAPGEDSTTTGVNSTPNEFDSDSGAAYVFTRSGTTWTQQAYLKASNTGVQANFGISVAVADDTVVVGAYRERSSTTGVNSTPNVSAGFFGAAYVFTRSGTTWSQQAYLKASNTGADDDFGLSVAVSGDTVVVGAPREDSSTTGVNSTPNENASDSGAAYVFTRSGTTWNQQAYLKASNTPPGPGASDQFGWSVVVSGDTVVVGAPYEDSSTTGVNSTPNESASVSGAAYVFTRSGTTWSQQAYLKASNSGEGDYFGYSVAVSGDTVVVGAYLEDSSTTGVNSSPNESATNSGAAYVFTRSGTTWSQQAYLKASNTGAFDFFGYSVAVSGDMVVVGAYREDSSTTGLNSTPNESASESGAAYVFTRSGTTWSQQAYLKAFNTGASDFFGNSVAVSGDTVVVGAYQEDSSTTGLNSTPDESATNSGAAYVFTRSGTSWSQQAYLKASNTGAGDNFGHSVAVSGDTVIVGAYQEDSSTTGLNSTPDESASDSGAAYVFTRSGTSWSQQAYLKASNTGAGDNFGYSVAVSDATVVVGAYQEDSSTTGLNSTPDESATNSGAAYVFTRSGTSWSQQAYLKASNTGAGDFFGVSVAVSGDTVVAAATGEDSSTTGVNSTPDESAGGSGAAYIFAGFGPADIAFEAPTGTTVTNASGTLAFGQTPPGQTTDRFLTIRNDGGLNLTGISATILGSAASQFTLHTAPPSSLVGGASAAFTLRFAPTSTGVKTATLSIASNDPDESTFLLNLSGTGNTPPVFSGYAISTAWQTVVTVSRSKLLANASDADGHALSVTAAGPASAQGGTAVLGTGILYTPPAGFSGTDTFPVTIADALGATVNGTVTVTVAAAPGTGGGSTTNPPQVTMQPGGKPKLTFQGIPGRTYRIERSTNMTSWSTLATVPASPTGSVEYIDENPPPGSAFYRLARP